MISMLPDPYTVNFDGVNIGISSVDVLFHLSSSSLSLGSVRVSVSQYLCLFINFDLL